jgi:hypothetical protein
MQFTRDGNFLRTPDEHRAAARRLRQSDDLKAKELAPVHEHLADAIQRRLEAGRIADRQEPSDYFPARALRPAKTSAKLLQAQRLAILSPTMWSI